MSSKINNKTSKRQQVHSTDCEPDPFRMDLDIKDDFLDFKDPLREIGILSEENQHPRQQQESNGTCISQVYCSSYSNINGKPHQECYQSQSIKQTNEGHNISEAKEAYKNSDGVMKSAYQRGLDEKGARFIKEKNTKTGKQGQHKVLKGIKENEIDNFNKEYNAYSKKCGFKKNYKALNDFGKNNSNVKKLTN
jgi:hypothetical protein